VLVGAGLLVAAMFGLAQTKSKGHRGRSAGFKAVHAAASAKSNAAATITSADGFRHTSSGWLEYLRAIPPADVPQS